NTKYGIQVLLVQYVPFFHDVLLLSLLLCHIDHIRHLCIEHVYTFHNGTPSLFAAQICVHKTNRLFPALTFGSYLCCVFSLFHYTMSSYFLKNLYLFSYTQNYLHPAKWPTSHFYPFFFKCIRWHEICSCLNACLSLYFHI